MRRLWWLSYADETFLGVAIVEADGFLAACLESHRLGINPGGQVVGFEVPDEEVEMMRPHLGRLLDREAVKALGARRVDGSAP